MNGCEENSNELNAVNYSLRLTQDQHRALRAHLFPGDGCEAVALLLCGRRTGEGRHIFTAERVLLVPHGACSIREPDRITWPTSYVDELLSEAHGRAKAIVRIHSHAEGYRFFSTTDDQSDSALFTSISSLLDDRLPHASAIMLPSGEVFGRVLNEDGGPTAPLSSVMVVGDDLLIWNDSQQPRDEADFTKRHAQAFGSGTIERLGQLSAAVVGCSGTGSVVVEQLSRLGIGKLVLVDPDVVEEKNLNRILNSTREDAALQRPKVQVLASAVERMGFGQKIIPIQRNLASREAVLGVAECDVVFGCVDSIEGRHLLNRLATFYLLPYFDVGIRLDADGTGGINSIAGAAHYLQPGRSSLLSRGVYSLKQVEAEEMKRTNPSMYEAQREQGYLRGVQEDRPAVISVNMFFAALVVSEFLARLHPYRNQPNSECAYVGGSLSEMALFTEPENADCALLKRHVGRGDTTPLLDMPALS